ncbi:MAG: hypothetical protein JWM21_2 [Acidobacteria bacterium]|nr:hypothetical protein [Acidobacteriota bacterium]
MTGDLNTTLEENSVKISRSIAIASFCALLVVACNFTAQSQTAGQEVRQTNIARISALGSSVRWDLAVPYASLTVTVSAPDGRVFRKELKAGSTAEFTLTDNQGQRLPDGPYTYELRIASDLSASAKATLQATRGKDDDPEEVRSTRKRADLQALVQSGTFSILHGAVIVAGAQEEPRSPRPVSNITPQPKLLAEPISLLKPRRHHAFFFSPDDVIPDDLIVQGSACVGLDCVNGEVFGFDSIRIKENNTRIQFDDTSTSAGFPTNNWQIRANSSASGGASFLSFVDQGATGNSETGTIVFEVDAGAPANSVKVDNTGRVGLGTGTPVLNLHINDSDTPATRLEQNNSGGFTAQTWDVAGNEANFFVRDVTGGSRLPFRIRPGAPTSSIDISADGRVGIGTASPTKALDVVKTGTDTTTNHAVVKVRTTTSSAGFGPGLIVDGSSMPSGRSWSVFTSGASDLVGTTGTFSIFDGTASASRLAIDSTGRVGIGTTAPTDTLSVNGTASKPGGGSWAVFSDERLKNIKGNFNSGLKAVMQLQPLRYEYRPNNALGIKSEGEHIGFGAKAVQQIVPEAVSTTDQGYLVVNNDPILWTMLNAIKEQQKEIEQLKGQVRQLRAASRRRR